MVDAGAKPFFALMEESKNPIPRVFGLLKGQRKTVTILVVLVAFGTALDIAVPVISQRLIDALISFFTAGGPVPTSTILLAAAGIFFATLVGRIVSSVYNYRLFTAVTKTEDALRHRAFEKYLTLHTLFHHESPSGQIIGRLERGAVAVYIILYDIFGHNLLSPLLMFVGVLIALAVKSPLMALVVFLPLPIYLLATRRLSNRIYKIERKSNRQFEAVMKESYDVASNVHTVKKFSQERAEIQQQRQLQSRARSTQYRAERLWGLLQGSQTAIAVFGRISVILLGGYFVITGRSTVGEFVLFLMLQGMAYQPLGQLAYTFPRLRRNITRVERLFAILDEPIRVADKPGAQLLPPLARTITFRHVWFRYASKKTWTLKDINLSIPANTTVALVGRSGSGKSTFINLLLRSFDPDRGAILIDGIDIRDVTQKSLRRQIAVVPQEVDLFSRTIAQNISYGRRRASRTRVEEAARMALAHDFIMRTEKGYRTLVGERGIKLSGGERQRIGIARAILRNPRILILDEATSHLDTESERLIQKATSALIKNRTSFIIAHRLSTVLHAALILVFNNGAIEAMGTHAQLLRRSPTYRRLYNLQFAN